MTDSPRLAISLLSYNWFDHTARTLESLRHSLTMPCYIDIVDDCSDKETQGKLEAMDMPDGRVCLLTLNVGLIMARNKSYDHLLRHVKPDYIVVAHNDMMFPKGMFEELVRIMDEYQDIGILGVNNTKDISDQTTLDLMFKERGPVKFVRGNAHPAIMRVKAIESILENGKVYDESFGRMDNEDIDCLGRLEYAGWKTCVATNITAYHCGELSRSHNPSAQKWKETSRAQYERKWKAKGKRRWDEFNGVAPAGTQVSYKHGQDM